MKKIQLVDTQYWDQLKPLTLTKSIADVRLGILTIKEKWEQYFNQNVSIHTRSYLQPLYGPKLPSRYQINSALLPNKDLTNEIINLKEGESLWVHEEWLATHGALDTPTYQHQLNEQIECNLLRYPEDIFINVGNEIKKDIALIESKTVLQNISATNTVIGDHSVNIMHRAKMECCILNTEEGPIYIGEGAHIMEGSMLRGPISIGANTVVKMGTRIYNNTSIGPWCKVGGEIKNSVILGYSNKAHDGYMGNSVIGEWCNWGADTNNSNMKNNYTDVKLWEITNEQFRNTGHQFVGLIMGDYSKTGINTMFNTGSVIGVSCNIYGTGFPRKFIPSFSWGGAHGFKTYQIERAIQTAQASQKRRDINLPQSEIDILNYIFIKSSKFRMWEKR
ncbi:MAG: putative sugar nucleotidyl transferase [Saprospiraceae bacterium]